MKFILHLHKNDASYDKNTSGNRAEMTKWEDDAKVIHRKTPNGIKLGDYLSNISFSKM